jgi:hypothetical protein
LPVNRARRPRAAHARVSRWAAILGRRATLLALCLVGSALVAPAAQAGWTRPFELVKPGTMDFLPTQLAFSNSGAASAGFSIADLDTPGSSQAYTVYRSARGSLGAPRTITGAQSILALDYSGSALQLITGTGPGSLDCCSTAQAIRISAHGAIGRPQTLVSGLAGDSTGQLVPLAGGRMVAAVGTEQGVWTLAAGPNGHFSGKHRLTGAGQAPESLAATWLGGQGSLVAWTSASGTAGASDPRTIFYAQGSKTGPPRRAVRLLQVPAGHRIDELTVARRGNGATAGWIESWFEKRGNYHSQVRAADFAAKPSVRNLSPANGDASGIDFASNGAGAQAVTWQSCTSGGSCTVHAATRAANGRFGGAATLGAIDASQEAAVTVGPAGQALVGWVRSGHPVAVVGPVTGHLGVVRVLSPSSFALDLTVAFGPHHDALAAWTQGTLNPSVVAADYHVG